MPPTPKDWTAPCPFPQMEDQVIHVWRISLMDDHDLCQSLVPLLADDELKRAGRFLHDEHRQRFVIGRARMRQLLAGYVRVPPAEIEFAYENLGKPRLRDPQLASTYHFNFSNSKALGLLAVTLHTELGIDLEQVRSMSDMLGLARRYFANSETDQLLALSPAAQRNAFFRCWTRKEAYLKAVGKGLTFPLSDVEVAVAPDTPCRIESIRGDRDEAAAWSLLHLDPCDGFQAALAIRRLSPPIGLFDADRTLLG